MLVSLAQLVFAPAAGWRHITAAVLLYINRQQRLSTAAFWLCIEAVRQGGGVQHDEQADCTVGGSRQPGQW